MKIILTKDVKKQGKTGDILNVKDGYGNFLIQNGNAVLATDNSLNRLNRENKEKQQTEEKHIEECKKLKNKLEKEKIFFKVKVGQGDKVFGSISAKQIVESLKELGYNIDKTQVNIKSPISSLGTHVVDIVLHKKVIANIKINITK